MILSTRAVYSLRVMIYLADNGGDKAPIKLKEIADMQGLPFKYLEQLMVPLRNARLVKSVQGKQGGYILARDPAKVSALDVVEAAAGPMEMMDCTAADALCKAKDICTSRKMLGLIETRITDILAEYSLKDLSEKRTIEQFMKISGEKDVQLRCSQ